MSYFNNFPRTLYKFGDTNEEAVIQNIAAYTEIIDELNNNSAFYNDYFIVQGTRPDQASFSLYNDPTYHWTFYLMNPKLREQGWPLQTNELTAKIVDEFAGTVITTRDADLFSKFMVGQTVSPVNDDSVTGTIVHRNIGLGQIILEDVTGTFSSNTPIKSTDEQGVIETITPVSVGPEYMSAHHYEDGDGNIVDIDPTTGPGAQITEVTHLQYYVRQNEALRNIRVIKPTAISRIVGQFRQAMS